ncbi:hypothetical protein CkaCkLH20_05025 [Colletotrichum karsti]|uniref:DNA-directed DNA polymerase n=1 Tax=Colletotrichum karsti TaxID=1095194 RepID=A0A9P6I7J6_9PEZI|nr:uncharacterized protein CkaCkLH20_05025 [Colletotrichum karsti]KAF9877325.1 hypothetical protein CkaCkLH20_05025 [Colletotrichum karsti]
MVQVGSHILRESTTSFVRLAKHHAFRRLVWRSHVRWSSAVAADATTVKDPQERQQTLAISSQSRFNDIGVQHLSAHVYQQVFPDGNTPPPQELVDLAKDHLRRHDLLGKNTDNSEPIAFDIPELQGRTMDEHFHKLAVDCAEPYLSLAKHFARATPPPKPRKWVRQSGWTKYYPDGRTEAIDAPDETMLCFDTEVMWKESSFAVMACASSPTAWYAWLSPWLLGESESDRHLIPLGDPTKERIIVGHNIGYDRARILEEYDAKQTRNQFLDTMSLHVAVNGMCSQQRPTWMKHKKNREMREKIASQTDDVQLAELLSHSARQEEAELWVERSSINSLRDVAKFHLDVTIDKAARDDFGVLDREEIFGKLDNLLDYCAADVAITHRVYQIVFPNFLDTCPHPVSFAALRHLASVILPVNKSWDAYIANAEATYRELSDAVQERLVGLTEKALEIKDNAEKWSKDPWLKQLDWSGQEIKMVKGKKKDDPPRPAARQKKPGMPQWYKDLFVKNDSPINITVRTRIAPLLLKMSWDNHPLVWSEKYGWTFRVTRHEAADYEKKQMVKCDFSDSEKDASLRTDGGVFFKLPHKDGPQARCVNPMAKGYMSYFENGTLSSQYPYAKQALEMNASCSYWISARDRIMSQMVVYEDDIADQVDSNGVKQSKGARTATTASKAPEEVQGYILPQVIPMGTITRRAVENTWLTASNAKKNRVGSELKSMVKAPPGYSFVGADVDSEELWIASLVGDATFRLHGGNAIGFMTLEGTKAAGTDLHSRTAAILGITRNDAKVFNYGRIYGAGIKFAGQLLRQFNPNLSDKETNETAARLYASTKGTKTTRSVLSKRPFWRGGTESFVFNKLEEFAAQERPRTFVLGAGITEALMRRFINQNGFLTSRINWAIQSSGVDYLHLLIVAMDYLTRRFNIEARLAITVHDEIRYLVKDHDKYRAAMALQVANLWTRAMFAQQAGINDLPQACAYFSAIDIDHVLRKEVDMDCVTPSHKEPIAPGESLDINALLAKGAEARLDPSIVPDPSHAPKLDGIAYSPRTPVMDTLEESTSSDPHFLKAQIVSSEVELGNVLKERRTALKSQEEKKPRVTKKKERSVLPYQSDAVLMPVETMTVSDALGNKFTRFENKNRWNWQKEKGRWSGPSSRI